MSKYTESNIDDAFVENDTYEAYGFTWFMQPVTVDLEAWKNDYNDDMLVLGQSYLDEDGDEVLDIYGYAESSSEMTAICLYRTTKLEVFGEAMPDYYGSIEDREYNQIIAEEPGMADYGEELFYRLTADEYTFDIDEWHADMEKANEVAEMGVVEPLSYINEDGYHVYDEPFIVPMDTWLNLHPNCVFFYDDVSCDRFTFKVYAFAEDDDSLDAFDDWNRSGIYPPVAQAVNGEYKKYPLKEE